MVVSLDIGQTQAQIEIELIQQKTTTLLFLWDFTKL